MPGIKLTLSILFLLVFVNAKTNAQSKISIYGTVKDETHLTLPGATVFLTGTKSITGTDGNGTYKLNNVAPGSYQIVIKMIGFKPFIKTVDVANQPIKIDADLKPDNQLLREVKIHPDYDREKHLALFKKQFLGETYNSDLCKLLNPDKLNFNYDKAAKVLNASAEDILIIQNNALGYRLKYLLTQFEYNENTRIVSYAGYPSFEEIKGTPKQETLWQKNRKIAYLGSINHFARAVYNNSVYQEGFAVYKLLNRPMLGIQLDSSAKQIILEEDPVIFDSLLTVVKKDLKSLTFKDCLYVVYKNERQPENFVGLNLNITKAPTTQIPHHGQVSLVYLLAPSVTLDYQGLYNPTNGLFFEGYWAWEKNADLMPVEYTAKYDGNL